MKQAVLAALLFLCIQESATSQSLIFADQFGGNDTQTASSIAADHDENIFVSITFYGEMDVDPGQGETKVESEGSADVALVKLTPTGELIWFIHLSSDLFENSRKVVTDDEGNVLICGYFKGTIDFDPGPGIHNLTPVGDEDGYLAKYDGDGNYLWAYRIGSSGYEEFYGVEVDSAGNVYSLGYFQNTIDFDPGAGVSNLTAIGGNANFFWKLDAGGNFIWAKQIAYTFAENLALDKEGNQFITGSFFGTVDVDPGPGVYNLSASGFSNDAFILKLDKDCNFQWAGKMSGSLGESGLCIGFDDEDRVLIGGRFDGTVDFDPGNGTYNMTSLGYYDAFLLCLLGDGAFSWAKSFGGAGWQDVSSLSVDAAGNIHLAGEFEQTCDFDPSIGTFNMTSNGYTDCYFSELDSAGNFKSAFQVGGSLDDWNAQMVLDDEDGMLTCGHFSWITDFDPGPEEYNLTSYTGWDGFAAKYCTAYTIENFVSICEGDSVFAGGAWQTEPGDYFDYYDPTIGCDSTVITHLSITEPEVDLGNDTSICENSTLLLDAGIAGATYLWSTGDTTQIIEVSEAGTYSVTVTIASGCIATDDMEVTLSTSPVVDLGMDLSMCEGNAVILNAGNSGADYLWSTGETTKKITVTEGGLYSVTVTNASGCSGYDTVLITVSPLPEVDLGADAAFCAGASVLLDAGNNGSDFLWNTGAITQTLLVTVGGAYSVSVTDANGCTGSDSVFILENPLPQVNLGDDLEICDGDTAILDAGNAGSSFLWSTGETSQAIYATAASPYSVAVTDLKGCAGSDTINVWLHPLPEVYFITGDTTVCLSSASVQLPLAFPWGGEYSGNGVEGDDFNPAIAGMGEHVITYSYTDSFGCSNEATIIITVTVCTGVGGREASAFRVFPNPTSGVFTISQLHSGYADLYLTDASGRRLMHIPVRAESETEVDLGSFPAGIYLLTSGQGTLIEKVVVQR